MPQRDREAAEPLYDEVDSAAFQQFAAYVGYRVVAFVAAGAWQPFVPGD